MILFSMFFCTFTPSSVKYRQDTEILWSFPCFTIFLILDLEKSYVHKKVIAPYSPILRREFSATYMKYLVSDILKVFREVVEINLFMALRLGLLTNVNFSLRDFRQVSYECDLTLFGTVGSVAIRSYKTLTLPTATCWHQIFISDNITQS